MKTTSIAAKPLFVLGASLMIAGVAIPGPTLIGVLRTIPEGLREHLFLGAAFFKAGLVLHGIFIMISAWFTAYNPEVRNENRFNERSGIGPLSILAGMLLIAFLMRLYNLNLGIWFDEIGTYVSYMGLSLGEILTTFDNQNNHLLYTILARLSFLIFGESVWSLRLPAVLFGVGSIWAVYLFSSQVATRKEGLLAASLLTFSYHHVWFSQNARGYTALLFWTVLSSWFLIRALREGRFGLWSIYGITTALGLMTHATMAFVVVGHGAVYLAAQYESEKGRRQELWWGGLFGFVVMGLVTFQLYSLVLPQLFNWQGIGVSPWQGKVAVMTWKSPLWMMEEFFKIATIGLGSGILLFTAMFVFGVGLVDFTRRKSPVVIFLTIPVLVGMLLIAGLGSTLLPRLFFFALGFAVIVLVRGLMICGNIVARNLRIVSGREELAGIGLCACAIFVSGLSVAKAYQPKQDFRGALDFVQNQRQPGDIILTVGLTTFPYQRFYKVDWNSVTTLEELDKAKARGTRTWLVYTLPIVLQAAHPEMMKRIQNDFVAIKEFPGTLSGGNIVVAVVRS